MLSQKIPSLIVIVLLSVSLQVRINLICQYKNQSFISKVSKKQYLHILRRIENLENDAANLINLAIQKKVTTSR